MGFPLNFLKIYVNNFNTHGNVLPERQIQDVNLHPRLAVFRAHCGHFNHRGDGITIQRRKRRNLGGFGLFGFTFGIIGNIGMIFGVILHVIRCHLFGFG